MELNIVPGSSCALHHIRMSKSLRYRLDLDLGDCLVFDMAKGQYALMVERPRLEDRLLQREYVAVVSKDCPILYEKGQDVYVQPHELTIGADPEIFLLDRKARLIHANQILPFQSEFGNDGHLAELRPEFALGPEQLVSNLGRLIKDIPNKLPSGIFPFASSYYRHRCAGFHIHLGLPIELLSFAADKTDAFLKNLVATLDYFVGIPTAALDSSDYRRFSMEYGNPGDYRLSMRTLEYRTPGGFNLVSPLYAKSMLSIAFFVMEKALHEAEIDSCGWKDMAHVAEYSYLKEKFALPEKGWVKKVMRTRDRSKLLEVSSAITDKLKQCSCGKDIITERTQTYKPLIQEWEYASKHEAEIHRPPRQTSAL